MAQGIKLYDGETLVYPRTVASEVFTSEGKTLESVINELKTLITTINNRLAELEK